MAITAYRFRCSIALTSLYLLLGISFADESIRGVVEPLGLSLTSPWPKFHGNAKNTGRSNYTGPLINNIRWMFKTGEEVGKFEEDIHLTDSGT
jgi:hypothetical protein